MDPNHWNKRMLAVDLSSRGFGYAVFDTKGTLVDWGIRRVSGNKNTACIEGIRTLLQWYKPEALVLEAYGDSRRPTRIRLLAEHVRRLAASRNVQVISVGWDAVRRTAGQAEKATKEQVAERMAELFPELRKRLPRKRQIWMSEDDRMNLFDAVALAVAATTIVRRKVRR